MLQLGGISIEEKVKGLWWGWGGQKTIQKRQSQKKFK